MPAFDFVLTGRYRLLAPLGEGGMATVYRARDLRLNREVAIKILRDDLTRDPEFLARFEREAQFVASLSHPNIVPVYDVGEEQGSHFIVMEYIRGRTLKDALEANGPLPPDRAVAIMIPILEALGYAHGRGIIHRDVKPQNILLGSDGTARLADFGIAHLADGSSTRTAAILGSAHYLSPEQARGEQPSAASDIYSCGIVLYEMLAGHPPFDGANALAVAHHHLHSPPPRLPISAAPQLGATVERALAKEPADRFPDTDVIVRALRTVSVEAGTMVAPLTPNSDTEMIERSSELVPSEARRGSHPVRRGDDEGAVLTLRRSARKTGVLALLCAAALGGAAYAGQLSLGGHQLPEYPSAPYAAVPAALAALLLLSWFHVRSWIYRMDANAAVMQWGLLSHHRFGVPVRSITTLELKQSPIDRVLGVGTVELCARDQHGKERRLVMEDLPRPRQTYEHLMGLVGRAVRVRPPAPAQSVSSGPPP